MRLAAERFSMKDKGLTEKILSGDLRHDNFISTKVMSGDTRNLQHIKDLLLSVPDSLDDAAKAALRAEEAGADLITLHLREDRRHIQDVDVFKLRPLLKTRMNLECAVTTEMLHIACKVLPQDVCLVPEKRTELTTEGGLDVAGAFVIVKAAVDQLHAHGIRVSLFIDPDERQIRAAAETGARLCVAARADGGRCSRSDV